MKKMYDSQNGRENRGWPGMGTYEQNSGACGGSVGKPVGGGALRTFWGCMSVFGIFCTVTVGLTLLTVILSCKACVTESIKAAEHLSKGNSDEYGETWICGPDDSDDKIAVIDVTGVISSGTENGFGDGANSGKIRELIRIAEEEDEYKAILMNLNTPGGEVTAADEIWHELKTCRKPVVVMMNSLAASGGYYIACAAKKIVANRLTLTGSIGVIIQGYNYVELLNKIGVKPRTYTSGPMKAMLAGDRNETPEENAVVNRLVRGTYLEFAKIVSEARKIPLDRITDGIIGDGRVFDGTQAFQLGLVDKLGYFSDAVAEAEKLASLKPGSAQAVRIFHNMTLTKLFSAFLADAHARPLQVTLPGTGAASGFRMQEGCLYFLPAGY